jgi:stress-induced morphogen
MELKQMMERQLEKMDTSRERMVAKMDANQAKTDATQRVNGNLRKEMKSTVHAFQERMDAWIADMKDGRKERTVC